jgi:hypothetical protein
MIETLEQAIASIRRVADRTLDGYPTDAHNTGIVFGMRLACDAIEEYAQYFKKV